MAWEEQRPERRQKADRNSKKSQDRGRGKKRERAQNKDFAKITYFFVILFIALMGYLVYFTTVKAKTFVNSPYNQRQDSFAQSVVRGDITDRMAMYLQQRKWTKTEQRQERIRTARCSPMLSDIMIHSLEKQDLSPRRILIFLLQMHFYGKDSK